MKKILSKMSGIGKSIEFGMRVSLEASKHLMVQRVLYQLLLAAIPSCTAYLTKLLLDTLSESSNIKAFRPVILLLAAYFVLRVLQEVISKLSESTSALHQDKISNMIDVKLMSQSNRLDISYFDSPECYDEAYNARIDSGALSVMTWSIISMLGSFLSFIIALVVMLKCNVIFTIVLIALSIPSVIVERNYSQKMYNWSRECAPIFRKMGYLSSIATDRGFAKDIRIFGIYDYIREKHQNLWAAWYTEKKEWTLKKLLIVTLISILPEIGILGILIYVCYQIWQGSMSIGDFTFVSGMTFQLIGAVWTMIYGLVQIYENNLKITNYSKFLSREALVKNDGTLEPSEHPQIEFKDVSFRYPSTDNYVLKNVSFNIKPGEKIAFVGENGSGKTTIVKLLLRLYDVTEGAIMIDGVNIKDMELNKLRRMYSVMFQDYNQYAFSVDENIRLSDINDTDYEQKLKESKEYFEIDKLCKKHNITGDTYLTRQFEENGVELSGGEWQKIALARAYFKRGSMLILDEPNAALDPAAEDRVFKSITSLYAENSAILISHRLSNVIMADRIFYIENGTITESGSHDELLKSKGGYARLFNLQAEKYVRSLNENCDNR